MEYLDNRGTDWTSILEECNLGSSKDLAYSYKEINSEYAFLHSTSGHHSQTSHMFFIHNKVQRNAAKLRESACLAEGFQSKGQIWGASPNIHNSLFCWALYSSLFSLILSRLLSKKQNTHQIKLLMQMADQQPCLEPTRTTHPVTATLDPSFQSVLYRAANPTHLCLLAGTCCKAAEDKMWHPSSSLQTDNALHNLSGWISLTTLVCLARRSSVVPHQANLTSSLASKVAKRKLKVQPPAAFRHRPSLKQIIVHS